jgi:hypothetical protein
MKIALNANIDNFYRRLSTFECESLVVDKNELRPRYGSVFTNSTLERLKENSTLVSFLSHSLEYLKKYPNDAEQIAHFLMGKVDNLPARWNSVFVFDIINFSIPKDIKNILYNILRVHRYTCFGKREAPEKTIAKLQALENKILSKNNSNDSIYELIDFSSNDSGEESGYYIPIPMQEYKKERSKTLINNSDYFSDNSLEHEYSSTNSFHKTN